MIFHDSSASEINVLSRLCLEHSSLQKFALYYAANKRHSCVSSPTLDGCEKPEISGPRFIDARERDALYSW